MPISGMIGRMARQRYVRRPDRPVVAIRLSLDLKSLVYKKWNDEQRAKPGDWLVESDGDVYTVDADSFARSYQQTGPGTFIKTTPVWAEQAAHPGSVKTKEGATHYQAGDYLVSNDREGTDAYAISAAKFETLYTRDDP
jgi:hypothetical protein